MTTMEDLSSYPLVVQASKNVVISFIVSFSIANSCRTYSSSVRYEFFTIYLVQT